MIRRSEIAGRVVSGEHGGIRELTCTVQIWSTSVKNIKEDPTSRTSHIAS